MKRKKLIIFSCAECKNLRSERLQGVASQYLDYKCILNNKILKNIYEIDSDCKLDDEDK